MYKRALRTNRFLLPVLVTGLVVVAAPAWGQVINDDVKLLASDGAALDQFGLSIAIENGVVAVGAHLHEDSGSQSGSAYLFNSSTGAPIAKLLPTDGAAGDQFGVSVAIENGVVAVGARADDDNGSASGSAYLFDASTGAQIAKLLPSDGSFVELFGLSIAIDNGVLAAGARDDDDNGSVSGSAYVFDVAEEQGIPIPSVSEWGLIVMTLLLLTSATLVYGHLRSAAA